MIERIALGIILGVVLELFLYRREDACTFFTIAAIITFSINSLFYAPIYFIMALCEVAVGYKISSWLRMIRNQHGV